MFKVIVAISLSLYVKCIYVNGTHTYKYKHTYIKSGYFFYQSKFLDTLYSNLTLKL